jgi:hypothetical protein
MGRVTRVLMTVAVLVAVLVALDRVAAWAGQRAVADQVAGELAAYQVDSAPPEVSVGGFPFLTQVAGGRYEEVTLRLRNVGSGDLRLSLVELTATGVTAPASTLLDGDGSIHAERVDGRATVGFDQVRVLTRFSDLRLGARDGLVTVRLPLELAGLPVTLVGTAGAAAADGVIQIRVRELTVEGGGALPPGTGPLVDEIARDLSVDVPLPPLPYGLVVTSVRADETGLVVSVTAADVPLSR